MPDHDLSRWCPTCDGEFSPWVEDCPDCGVPLSVERPGSAAVDEEEGADELEHGATTTLPVSVSAIAVALGAAALLAVLAGLIGALAYPAAELELAGEEVRRRIEVLARPASPTLGLVVLLAAAGVAWEDRFDGMGAHLVLLASSLVTVLGGIGVWLVGTDEAGFNVGVELSLLQGPLLAALLAGTAMWLQLRRRPL